MFGRRGRPWPREREGPAPQAWEGFTVPNIYGLVIRGTLTDNHQVKLKAQILRMTERAAQNDKHVRGCRFRIRTANMLSMLLPCMSVFCNQLDVLGTRREPVRNPGG